MQIAVMNRQTGKSSIVSPMMKVRYRGDIQVDKQAEHLMVSSDSHVPTLVGERVAGVPRTTIFETQTCKEISAIEWFKVDDLPASKTPGSR